MASITTSIRLDKDLKERASKLAKEMGLSLSQVAENYFRQFLRDEKIVFAPIYDDTDPRYYETDDTIPVNEPAEVVLEFLENLNKERANG